MKKQPRRQKRPAAARAKIPGQPVPGPAGAPVRARRQPVKPAARKKPPVKRKLALGEAVACCAAEALAASLRLTGWPVPGRDVLALYELTAGDPDEGATILATLEAAAERGLAGMRPLTFREVMPDAAERYAVRPLPQHETRAGLILGADLPGPHALLDDGAAWWSWGRPYDPAAFPDAVVEEAWEITWPPR